MGWWTYECTHCGQNITEETVVVANGFFAKGNYDDYGGIRTEEEMTIQIGDADGKFNIYHEACWHSAGMPKTYNGKLAQTCQ